MITLKSKIVKSEFIRKAQDFADKDYKDTRQPEYQKAGFMNGVRYTLNELQLKK